MARHMVIGMVLLLGLAACTSPLIPQTAMVPPKAPILPASSPEALAAGTRLAQQHCARCHAEGSLDGQASSMDLTGHAWTGHAWHHPDSVLVHMIAEGLSRPTGVMPPFGTTLRPEEINTVLAFIKTLWTPEQLQLQLERTQRADFTMRPR
jgi:mono/diheme cytochrome c family protein